MSSPAPSATACTPRILRVAASATSLIAPRVSRLTTALGDGDGIGVDARAPIGDDHRRVAASLRGDGALGDDGDALVGKRATHPAGQLRLGPRRETADDGDLRAEPGEQLAQLHPDE